MEQPTLRLLEYLLAIAEHGTFRAATEALHVRWRVEVVR
jgi:DNA-binding transcriptional LysR family regulator